MIGPQGPFAVQADWIVPVEAAPIPNGIIVVHNGTIQFVGNQLPSKFNAIRLFHLAGFAILPGLINSHCHLEFSDLKEPIPTGDSFPDWIRNLLAYRSSKNNDPEQLRIARCAAISSGILESYQAGVRWIVDMATNPWEPAWIDDSIASLALESSHRFSPPVPICIQPCFEFVDIVPQRFKLALALAEKQIAAPESKRIARMGYAPHASYTASLNVTRLGAELSRAEKRLVTMHLAESREEMDWIQDRKGPFSELLGPIISKDYFEELGQISAHVELLKKAWRAMFAHGNYLSTNELVDLASHSHNCAIVHCARTHHFFGHQHEGTVRYPLAERMAMGVKHFLGTDSRASNPDLSIWSEAKRVRVDHPRMRSVDIIKMITIEPAEFLCIQDRYGSVRVGQPSTLTAVKLAQSTPTSIELTCVDNAANLYDLLLASSSISSPLELVIPA